MGAQKTRKEGLIPLKNVQMHVMGSRQCLFLERMISETPVVKTMVSNVYVIVKRAQPTMENVTCLIIMAIVCTNTARLVSSYLQVTTKY